LSVLFIVVFAKYETINHFEKMMSPFLLFSFSSEQAKFSYIPELFRDLLEGSDSKIDLHLFGRRSGKRAVKFHELKVVKAPLGKLYQEKQKKEEKEEKRLEEREKKRKREQEEEVMDEGKREKRDEGERGGGGTIVELVHHVPRAITDANHDNRKRII